MSNLQILNAAEQVANHLRNGIREGTWSGTMPGGASLAKDLGVGRMTINAALTLLEECGELIPQGERLPRLISPEIQRTSSMKIAFLPYLLEAYRFDYMLEIQQLLQEQGHTVIFPKTSIFEMKENIPKVMRMVDKTQADAWVVVAGTRKVLDEFIKRKIPTFALFGRKKGIPLAAIGPNKSPATKELVRHFIELGHRRILLLVRPLRRLPAPGEPEQAFLDALEEAGIQTGSFNLPDWDGRKETLSGMIDSLFALTPPTAMLIDEPPVFLAVQHHLARKGILAPQHVSLACTDSDPDFDYLQPPVAHLAWDSRPWVHRIIQWVGNVSQGKPDLRQSLTKTRLILGGSIGPAP